MRGQGLIAASALAAALACAPQAGAQQYRSYHDEHVSQQQQCESDVLPLRLQEQESVGDDHDSRERDVGGSRQRSVGLSGSPAASTKRQ